MACQRQRPARRPRAHGVATAAAALVLAALALTAAPRPAAGQAPVPKVPRPTAATAATAPRGAAAAAAAPAPPRGGAPAPTLTLSPGAIPPPPAGGPAFKIGGLLPLTGPKSGMGAAVKAGMQMAVRDAAASKLPGVKVSLVFADSQCTDVPALRAAARLIRVDGVDAIVGDICSSASLAASGVANKFQVPMVSPASTATSLSTAGDYFFRTVPSDRFQGQYAANKMSEVGVTRVVVAYEDGSYGQSLAFAFVAGFTKGNGTAYMLPFPRGATNTSAVIDELRRTRANGLFIASNNVPWMGALLKALHSAQPPLTGVRVFGGDSLMDAAVAAAAGPAAALGVRGTDTAFGSAGFVADFKDFTGGKVPYSSKAAAAYDAVIALFDAYRRAGPPKEGPQVLAALQDVKFLGKTGPLAFDEYGDRRFDPTESYDVGEFDRTGNVRMLDV